MKVFHVFYQRKTYGGSESYVNMLREHSKHEHTSIFVERRFPNLPSAVNTYFGFRHLINDKRSELEQGIVHSHFFVPGLISQQLGMASITTSHCLLSQEYALSVFDTRDPVSKLDLRFSRYICEMLEHAIYPRISNLLVLSDFHKNELRNLGASPRKLRAPIDLAAYRKPVPKRDQPNARYFTLLFLARPTYLKGLHLLIEALDLIDASLPIRLVVVGDSYGWVDDMLCYSPCVGSSRDVKSGILFRMRADKRRVEVRQPVAHNQTSELYHECDALVCPSLYESIGFVNMEAMASGVPVIASSAGGISEIVRHESTGLVFRNGSASDLARQIVRLYAEDDLRSKIISNAYELIRQHDIGLHVAEIDTIYDNVAGLKSRRKGAG